MMWISGAPGKFFFIPASVIYFLVGCGFFTPSYRNGFIEARMVFFHVTGKSDELFRLFYNVFTPVCL